MQQFTPQKSIKMCFRTGGKFTKSKISQECYEVYPTLMLFGQFPILKFGIDHSGSVPFNYSHTVTNKGHLTTLWLSQLHIDSKLFPQLFLYEK